MNCESKTTEASSAADSATLALRRVLTLLIRLEAELQAMRISRDAWRQSFDTMTERYDALKAMYQVQSRELLEAQRALERDSSETA